MARYGGLLFLMSATGATVCGKLSDRWIASGSSITLVRKGSMAIGCTGFAISLSLMAIAANHLLIWTIVPTGLFLGISGCATWAIPQTLAGPDMVGRWIGLQNFVGNFAGAVAPALTGYLLDRTGLFYWPFFITAGIALLGGFAWTFIIGPIEPVNWDEPSRPAFAVTRRASPESARP
jgi:hypothetical protein